MTDIRGIIHIAKKGACQLTHLPAELPLAKRPDSGTSLPVNTTREKNKIFWFTTTYEIHYRIWRSFITEFGGLLLPNLAKKHVKVAKIPTSQRMRSGEICYYSKENIRKKKITCHRNDHRQKERSHKLHHRKYDKRFCVFWRFDDSIAQQDILSVAPDIAVSARNLIELLLFLCQRTFHMTFLKLHPSYNNLQTFWELSSRNGLVRICQ